MNRLCDVNDPHLLRRIILDQSHRIEQLVACSTELAKECTYWRSTNMFKVFHTQALPLTDMTQVFKFMRYIDENDVLGNFGVEI